VSILQNETTSYEERSFLAEAHVKGAEQKH
jgi:hypothetical protein